MQMKTNGPTWKIIATSAAIIIAGMIGWFADFTFSEIKDLKEKKVDKEQYCQDISEIKTGIAHITDYLLTNKK